MKNLDYLEERKLLVDKRLQQLLNYEGNRKHEELTECIRYSVLNGGKRIRPLLCLAAYEIFDKDISRALDCACGIELIHSATLILDDLPCMDNASYRRGGKAAHAVYGEGVSILAGMAMMASYFGIISKIKHPTINSLVEETAASIGSRGLALGQFLDLKSFGKEITIEGLKQIYHLKSAVLFSHCAKIGGLLGKASERELKHLESFGNHYGLAFQIKDDMVDVMYSRKEAGKDVMVDEKNKKMNYLRAIGLHESKRVFSRGIKQARNSLQSFGKKAEHCLDLCDMLDSH